MCQGEIESIDVRRTLESTRALQRCEVLPVGSTAVHCRMTDGNGRSNECSFQITVADAPPTISLHRAAGQGNYLVRWPQTCVEWVLESSFLAVGSTGWTPVEVVPPSVTAVGRVILPAEGDQRFFRLRRPRFTLTKLLSRGFVAGFAGSDDFANRPTLQRRPPFRKRKQATPCGVACSLNSLFVTRRLPAPSHST
jgi:hypothetical protein